MKHTLLFILAAFIAIACNNKALTPPPSYGAYPTISTNQITQTSFYVDPVAGSDANNCTALATPCKHWSELVRRWGPGAIFVNGGLQIYAGPTTTLGSGCTSLQSGTLSSVVGVTRTTNTPESYIDTAITTWVPVLGRRLRITSGARAGNFDYPAKSLVTGLGVSQARGSGVLTSAGSAGTFVNGDPYQIDSQISATLGAINPIVDPSLSPSATQIFILGNLPSSDPIELNGLVLRSYRFQDFDFSNAPTFSMAPDSLGTFLGCRWLANSVVSFMNAGVSAIGNEFTSAQVQTNGALSSFSGCLFLNGLVQVNGGKTGFNNDSLIQGGQGLIVTGGSATVGTAGLGIFDATVGSTAGNPRGSAVVVGSNSTGIPNVNAPGVALVGLPNANTLYGSGSTAAGLDILASSVVRTVGLQTITGSVDFELGASTTQCRAFDETAGAYTAARSCTWALFGTSVAGGGFGGNVSGNGGAHNVTADAHLVGYL